MEEDRTEMSVAAREGEDDATVSSPWGRASHFPRFSGYKNKQTPRRRVTECGEHGDSPLRSLAVTPVAPGGPQLSAPLDTLSHRVPRPGWCHTQRWRGRGYKGLQYGSPGTVLEGCLWPHPRATSHCPLLLPQFLVPRMLPGKLPAAKLGLRVHFPGIQVSDH